MRNTIKKMGEIDIFVAGTNEDTTTSAPDLPVQNRVKNGIRVSHILDEQGVAVAKSYSPLLELEERRRPTL